MKQINVSEWPDISPKPLIQATIGEIYGNSDIILQSCPNSLLFWVNYEETLWFYVVVRQINLLLSIIVVAFMNFRNIFILIMQLWLTAIGNGNKSLMGNSPAHEDVMNRLI